MAQPLSHQPRYRFPLIPGETIKIGGVPYEYACGGYLVGMTDPEVARGFRDLPDECQGTLRAIRDGHA